MEHKKYNQVLIGLDIVNIIDEKVQQWAKEYWNDDGHSLYGTTNYCGG